jgi:hypothetical protein
MSNVESQQSGKVIWLQRMRRNGQAFNPRKQQRDSEIEGKTTRPGGSEFQRRSKRSTSNAQRSTPKCRICKWEKLIQLQWMLSNVKSLLSGIFGFARAREPNVSNRTNCKYAINAA